MAVEYQRLMCIEKDGSDSVLAHAFRCYMKWEVSQTEMQRRHVSIGCKYILVKMGLPKGNCDCCFETLSISCIIKLAHAIFSASGEEAFATIADRRTCNSSKEHKDLKESKKSRPSSLEVKTFALKTIFLFFDLLRLGTIAFFVFLDKFIKCFWKTLL